ncbi:hypothetical protein OROGR_005804 [Orobanche gracilis]
MVSLISSRSNTRSEMSRDGLGLTGGEAGYDGKKFHFWCEVGYGGRLKNSGRGRVLDFRLWGWSGKKSPSLGFGDDGGFRGLFRSRMEGGLRLIVQSVGKRVTEGGSTDTGSNKGGGGGGSQTVPELGGGHHSNDNNNNGDNNDPHNRYFLRHLLRAVLYFTLVTVACLVIFQTSSESPFQFFPRSMYSSSLSPSPSSSSSATSSSTAAGPSENDPKEVGIGLKEVLKRAAMSDKTVIITTLNEAWIEPNSIFDLFLESFRIGNRTHRLLKHLVVVSLDQRAFDHCLKTQQTEQLHCYFLTTSRGIDFSGEAQFMSPDYLEMMWTRIDFLATVLDMGYSFVFTGVSITGFPAILIGTGTGGSLNFGTGSETAYIGPLDYGTGPVTARFRDADIMWLRNPFPHFYTDTNFQISCDLFGGNTTDLNNAPNGGFNYVRSANQTVEFYRFWYESRRHYPGKHDQDVLNQIKLDPFIREIGLEIKFLDTVYFGGFCQPSRDLNRVCTMHANCCAGLDNKIHDLRILLDDWKNYLSLPENVTRTPPSWSCSFVSSSYSKEKEWKQKELKNDQAKEDMVFWITEI